MTKGFLTFALNKPQYIGLAVNLASTIKAADYGAEVALVTNLNLAHIPAIFDKVITTHETNPFRLKTNIYKITPFKETVFIDADSLFNHIAAVPAKIWESVEGVKVSFPVLGLFSHDKPAPLSWVKLPAFARWAGFEGVYPAVYSGLFYFKKSREASSFFKAAAKLYGTYPECGTMPGGYYPDEPFFSMVAAKKGLRFGELNGFVFIADKSACNETQILRHCILTMPGQPRKEFVRVYNAIALKAGNLGFPVSRYQK